MKTIFLLIISNTFMTLAWYGHLKFKDKPLWLTILATVAAAWATYVLAPGINRQFALDDARSAHITKNIDGLNSEVIELSQNIRRLNDALVNERPKAPAIRQQCLDSLTKLQWRLVDLRVVLKSHEDRTAVSQLSNELANVKRVLDLAVDKRAQPQLLEAMRRLGTVVQDVLGRLYATAHLK